jgi:hypothetical protein
MDCRIFEAMADDQWPQDGVVIRVNWPRGVFALLPATMILLALGFKAGQAISIAPSAVTEVPSAPKAESTLQFVADPASQGTDSRSPLNDLEVELRPADDTLVEHQSVRWAMTDPDLAAGETALPLGKAERDRSGARLVRATEAAKNQAALLLGKGERLRAEGDISGARLSLRRAAEGGNARAALSLGETYEGGADADPAMTRTWYEIAAELGSAEARQRLDRPASGNLPSRR